MLDIKTIRENPELIKKNLIQRLMELDLTRLIALDREKRRLLREVEELKHKRNAASREIGRLKKAGKDISGTVREMKAVAEKIHLFDGMINKLADELKDLLMRVPNIPHPDVPIGPDMRSCRLVREEGEKRVFDFTPRNHLELGEMLGVVDFRRGVKVVGSHFALYRDKGALLERALINFMLDEHTGKNGYIEISPPFISNRDSMVGTGQLPLLEDDMYNLRRDDYFLIPTGEVPITNLHRGEILNIDDLPIKYVGYTPCFRREAGSYGKETRGLIRIHQFDKVELVKLVDPSTSYQELETLLADAEGILGKLALPYRVVMLPTGELSFASAKCYDIEVWAPGQDEWLEVSSVSNFEDFQARRANIRYRDGNGKIHFLHTLNGSGLALPRTVVALLENYQEADGSVIIPEVLRPYMRGLEKLT
ncbi:MAG: serine--tRNA ligase [Candidatus Euphemobacter frigidus]|nr:serine--tRNA ligase [Candidatus Euphemobacter frigidus]